MFVMLAAVILFAGACAGGGDDGGFEFIAADDVGEAPFVSDAAAPVPVEFVALKQELESATQAAEQQTVLVTDTTADDDEDSRLGPIEVTRSRQQAVIEIAQANGLSVIVPSSPAGVGLYGGSGENVCDINAMSSFFATNPDAANAWSKVHNIEPSDIDTYLTSLTAGFLLDEHRVVNHGYASGRANSFNATLEAGTAVLVDDEGIPRVRCKCGNPLAQAAGNSVTRLEGTFEVATVKDASSNFVGDLTGTRIWSFEPDCESGPCGGQMTSQQADGTNIVTHAFELSDGQYQIFPPPELGRCVRTATGELVQEEAYNYTYTWTVRPTRLERTNNGLIVNELSATQRADFTPLIGADSSCTAGYWEVEQNGVRAGSPLTAIPVADLAGRWRAYGYGCPEPAGTEEEIVDIVITDQMLVATKVRGDACIETGEVTFTAEWDGSAWNATWFGAQPGAEPAVSRTDRLIVQSSDMFRDSGVGIRFEREDG